MGLAHFLIATFAFIAVSCSEQSPEVEQLGQSKAALGSLWQATTPMPEQRRYHSATVLTSDKVLVVGGWGYSGLVAGALTYDPATATWSPAGTLALAREAHTATRLPSGKVLVVGGETFQPPSGYTNTAELYEPATNTWSPAGAMSQARGYNTATLLLSNKVLVAGGLGGAPLQTAELYDVAAGTWSTAAPMLDIRRSHTAVRLASGKVLVAGGWGGWPLGPLATTELYEPTTNTWTAGRPMLTARYGHTATELPNGKILVVGGQKANSPSGAMDFTATAELYDPSTQTWTPAGTLLGARGFHTATLFAGKVLVAGGRGPGDVALATAEVYDPATNTWSSIHSLLGARSDHAAVSLNPRGEVLVIGGSTHAALATVEMYEDPCGLITCNTPPNSQCYLPAGTCSSGTCTYTLKSAGSPCDDGNACTKGDTCNSAGACSGTAMTCSTASSTYCSGNDVRKTVGTGTCSGGACGSTDSFVQSCSTGTSGPYCSGNSAYQTVYGGCLNGACTSTERLVETCSSGSSYYCSGNSVWVSTGTGTCSGGSCGSTHSFVQSCSTGSSYYCSGNDVWVSSGTGTCSGGSCGSTHSFVQSCPTGTSYGDWGACVPYDACGGAGTRSRTVTQSTCSGGACGGNSWTETQPCEEPPAYCPTGSLGTYCSGNQVFESIGLGCSGSACRFVDRLIENCPTGTSYGDWGSCIPNDACGGSGTESRTVTQSTCSGGACGGRSWTETRSCYVPRADCPTGSSYYCSGNDVRVSTGTGSCSGGVCGFTDSFVQSCPTGTSYGAWSECSADACGGSGTQTRTVTESSCSGGTCGGNSWTETQSCSKPPVSCSAGQYCSGGSCVNACAANETWCNGMCTDTSTDFYNCGGCGMRCANAWQACVSGACEYQY
ncbi:hypothetical protein NR798_05980 [Archangium gephyra]|uniref:kelch repeat-containing protein n=1 Tax=Archangium gephyra TaxID=48 RepID=UPI0035D47882